MNYDFKCYLLDMDGTVYLGGKAIDGAAQTVERMRKQGKVLFLTNNTSCSRRAYATKLFALGIPAREDDIFTAGNATIDYIAEHYSSPKVYVLGTELLKSEFAAAGLKLVENSPELVVVGFDTSLTYEKLSKTCSFIQSGVPFIATHPDFNCPVGDGYIPDVGSFLALIEASTGRRPDAICGKPYAPMANALSKVAKASGKDVVMVGDRLYTDMRFAAENGFCSTLVLSGEATREELAKSGIKVDRVIASIKDFFDI